MVDGPIVFAGSIALFGGIFAIFNIPENTMDLTDRGRELAKQKRINERREAGIAPRINSNPDPYAYKIPFLDDDDEDVDINIINGGSKKKTGGCG